MPFVTINKPVKPLATLRVCQDCGLTKHLTWFERKTNLGAGDHYAEREPICETCMVQVRKVAKAKATREHRERLRQALIEEFNVCGEYRELLLKASAKRRHAAMRFATPLWADFQAIRAIYERCRNLSAESGITHHVDHIVPIQARRVCGLHVPDNLRIIPATDNLRKCNKLLDEAHSQC